MNDQPDLEKRYVESYASEDKYNTALEKATEYMWDNVDTDTAQMVDGWLAYPEKNIVDVITVIVRSRRLQDEIRRELRQTPENRKRWIADAKADAFERLETAVELMFDGYIKDHADSLEEGI